MEHQRLIVPVVVHDLPTAINYQHICQSLLKLRQAQQQLIQHLQDTVQQQRGL